MRRLATFAALPLICLAAACENTGANYQPVIDGPIGPNYYTDLNACQTLAANQPALGSSTAQNVAVGAGAAAGVGGSVLTMRNQNGVTITLENDVKGVELALGAKGFNIEFK